MPVNAFYFSAAGRQLYGVYEPSAKGGDAGAVLCAPWGQEYLRAHQAMRQLGRMLARDGVHVLRFDYFGTGDSEGSDLDATITQSVEDTSAAIEELTETAGVRRIVVVGLRLGAAIATMAARARREVQRIVLWDPVFDGRSYLDELTPPDNARVFPLQIAGLRVSEHAFSEIRDISLDAFAVQRPSTIIVNAESQADADPLVARLARDGVGMTREVYEGPKAWLEAGNSGTAGMPIAALRAIVRGVTS